MSNRRKIQHYVPKFYLKHFTIAGRQNYLYCFDKANSKKFVTHIRNIACEANFYEFTPDMNGQAEKIFSRYESRIEPPYNKLIGTEDVSCLTVRERWWLATFISIQLLRTRQARLIAKSSIEARKQKLRKDKQFGDLKLLELIEKLTEPVSTGTQVSRYLHMLELENMPAVSREIYHMKWILLKNTDPMTYWSSDNPINLPKSILGQLLYEPTLHDWDLLSAVYFAFPLTPRLNLWVCDPQNYKSDEMNHAIIDVKHVDFHNFLQALGSNRFIFSDQDLLFPFAELVIKHFPWLADIAEKRV